MHVVDAGANVGYVTLFLARAVGPHGSVTAFEPSDATFAVLGQHLRLNRAPNVVARREALGASDGEATLVGGATHALARIATGGGSGPRVPVRALDALVERGEVPPADLVKMDIEGAELEAVHGARETLRRHPALLFVAIHDIDHDRLRGTTDLLLGLGYDLFELSGEPVPDAARVLALHAEGKAGEVVAVPRGREDLRRIVWPA